MINKIRNESFNESFIKIPNSFIYTSGSIRGLERLLEIWNDILLKLPNSTLNISSYETFPNSDFDRRLNKSIEGIKSITHLGKLNQKELYTLMGKSEYWLYPCCFDETSCITAMEMMAHNVICLYYPRAGLTDTMNGNGIQISHGNEIETLLKSLYFKPDIIKQQQLYSKSCSWDLRAKEWKTLIKKDKMIFYAPMYFAPELLAEYIESLKTKFDVIFTKDLTGLDLTGAEIVFVHDILFDNSVFDKTIFKNNEISYLNTEPLNLKVRIDYILNNVKVKNKIKNFYDYSLSNIKILNDHFILNTIHLPYLFNSIEVDKLKEIKAQTSEIYDFGIICSGSVLTTEVEHLTPPRRKKLVIYLLSQGFTINIISGWGDSRDHEIAKCKQLLNIHGQCFNDPSTIFEHNRCNRLLYAGYSILSETSEYLPDDFINQFPKLKFKNYNDFFTLKKVYCFIHSCNIKGTKRLNHLIEQIKNIHFEQIFINNIGPPIIEKYINAIVTNYSDNNLLFEIPTINKIKQFSELNPNCKVLYVHTKGVSFNDDYQEENDWINMMLYFLTKPRLNLDDYDTIGCNYTIDGRNYYQDGTTSLAPPHYSGNFWWAKTNYLASLPLISENAVNKNDAEYWLHKNNPKYYELHHSGIDHYLERYTIEKYCNDKVVICFKFTSGFGLSNQLFSLINAVIVCHQKGFNYVLLNLFYTNINGDTIKLSDIINIELFNKVFKENGINAVVIENNNFKIGKNCFIFDRLSWIDWYDEDLFNKIIKLIPFNIKPNNFTDFNVLHIRMESDSVHWAKQNNLPFEDFLTLLETKYINLVYKTIPKGENILILSGSTNYCSLLKKDYNVLYNTKTNGDNIDSIYDLVTGSLCKKVFIGNFNFDKKRGSTFSYILSKLMDNSSSYFIDLDQL